MRHEIEPKKMTGADLVIRLLQDLGVQHVSGIPGGNILPLYDALARSSLRHTLVRHEQAAAFIAQGFARASGQVGVCFATSGPGATNLLTGIADAWRDSIPVVAITGQVPRALIGTQAFQEIDIVKMAANCSKACFAVSDAKSLAHIIPHAFALAQQGRPGPVWIDIPKDVFLETVEPIAQLAKPLGHFPRPHYNELQRAVNMLQQASRPLLYIGGGIISSNGSGALRALSEHAQIPVVSTLMGLGAFPTEHPLFMGMLGMHGHPVANLALERADLLIVAGARFDDRATGTAPGFARQAQVIHIDCDAGELGRLHPAELLLHGDARQILQQLRENISADPRRNWVNELKILQIDNPMPAQASHQLLQQIAEVMTPQTFVATDVGQHQMWTAQSYPLQFPRQWLTSGGLGTMGFGLPAAIGASIAFPERKVLCITGDGSIQMNLPELATLAELGTNVKICILNNAGLGMVRQQQHLFFDKRYSACEYSRSPDFAAIARGFGIRAERLDAHSMSALDSWKELLQSPGPALLDIQLDSELLVWPMVPAGKRNSEMLMPS